jgi:APA family basic amino acid/polyamine antiporter
MVASLSEEVVHPEKNMPIGIVGSLIISTLLYVTVSLVVVAMAPISVLGETVPIVNALQANSCCSNDETHELAAAQYCINASCYPAFRPWLGKIAGIVSVGAVLGLIASVFTSLMGQPRILYSLARDGLIHPVFVEVDPLTQVPRTGIILTGILTALLACFAPMAALGTSANDSKHA